MLAHIDEGSGHPVVLVHGFADSLHTWRHNTAALVDAGLRVIAVDQPGMGDSPPPPRPYRYTVDNQAAAVMETIDALGLDSFDLVGNSMGGAISLLIAVRHPARVRRMVLLDPAAYRPKRPLALQLPLAPQLARLTPKSVLVAAALRQLYADPSRVDPVLRRRYVADWSRPHHIDVLVGLSRDFFSPAFAEIADGFGAIPAQTTVVWGREDRWIPYRWGERVAAAIPDARCIILDDCGHVPHQESPGRVNAILVEALAGGAITR